MVCNLSTEDTISLKEVSCRVTNSVIKYLESQGYDSSAVVEGLPEPYTKSYLTNSLNWVTYEIREIICRRAAALTHDDAVMYKVGLMTPVLNPLGGLEAIIGKLAGPLMTYRFVPHYSRLLDRVFKFKTTITGRNTATVTMFKEKPQYKPSKDSCYYAQGILAAIPTLWGLPQAEIREKKCMHQPVPCDNNDVEYNAEACVYDITWQPLRSWRQRLRDNIFGKLVPVRMDFKELEESLRLIDQRNKELFSRNKQLAAVREIAISVDRVRTIDEALALTVEQAREIEGVRMVLVQKMDEAHENVITPYYSTFRGESRKMLEAVKLLGLDLEKVLGRDPNSNLLRLPLSKLKVALEYNKKPRVMVIPTLAELLDGVWPRALCDSMQKIGGIKKCVIVPLMVEGESWGHILYMLTQEVPIDILEMIGGHCAQAIKNIITLNNLEKRNAELSALNRIANITSKSLDMKTLLDNTLKEIADIFHARAVSVYLADKPGEPLKLTAQYGMVEERARELTTIRLDEYPMGKFFTSSDNLITGGVEDFVDNIPKFKDAILKEAPTRYMTAVLHFGSARYGLVTVLREGAQDFGEDEKSLLLSIANQLAVCLENSILHRDVIRRAEEAEIARASLEELFRKHEITEEKLRESEERYRTIFESANDMLILLDNNGTIIDINARVEDIGGYARTDLIGKDFKTLNRILTKKSLAILVKNYLKRLAGMEVPIYDIEMITHSGERRNIQVSAVAIRKENKIIGDLAILRDITSLKQAEKNLKSQKALIDRVLATIPNAVLLLDHETKVIMANQAFYTLFNLKKNQVERKPVNKISELPDFNVNFEEALKGKMKETSREIRYSTGVSEKILLVNIFSMRDENLLIVINDVTEERERQERLYLTDRLASIGEMASGVAHELNNPLTSIMGLAGLLITKDTPESVKEDLQAINAEAQRCAAIVKNLLAFARKHTLNKEPVQLTNVVKDVLKLRSYEHKAKGIMVETAFPPDLPKVLADYYQMQQVFLNIIINAEAAMFDAHQQGRLVISAKAIDGMVSVSFTDDGPGIKKEHMGLIFNPFFTTKETGKGTGLGLSIVYGIVTSHGGKVYAASEPGKGATFTVELPAVEN